MDYSAEFKTLVDDLFDKKSPKTPPLVEVLWYDATDIGVQWFDKEELDKCKPAPSLAVGYLFHKDEECIKIVSLVNQSHGGNGLLIPTGMVKKINYLKR